MESIGVFFREIVDKMGSRPALLYRPGDVTETWSYDRLWEESSRTARWFQDQGIEKGDRVVFWAPNSPSWVAFYFGAFRAGAILVPR